MATFTPHSEDDISSMLGFLGLSSLEELFDAVPAALRLAGGLDLEPGRSEADVVELLAERAAKNRPIGRSTVCFAGAGAYDHEVPAVTRHLASRSEFVTAYTPYQPEVAQGVLQAIFEYQTLVARLAGLEIANASLYDGAAALVEGVNLAVAATGSSRVCCSAGVHPHWRAALATFARGTGHEIEIVPLKEHARGGSGTTDWEHAAAGSPCCRRTGRSTWNSRSPRRSSARQSLASTGGRRRRSCCMC
jgi:glycine dehydrogenase subunit 1